MSKFTVRFPLLVRGAIALLLMGIVRLGIALGWLPAEWSLDEVTVEKVIDTVIFAWAWVSSQKKVTPVADPKDDHGRRLVHAGSPRAL